MSKATIRTWLFFLKTTVKNGIYATLNQPEILTYGFQTKQFINNDR